MYGRKSELCYGCDLFENETLSHHCLPLAMYNCETQSTIRIHTQRARGEGNGMKINVFTLKFCEKYTYSKLGAREAENNNKPPQGLCNKPKIKTFPKAKRFGKCRPCLAED